MTQTLNSNVQILPMTAEEYKNGGENLMITHSFAETPVGNICIASTSKGICSLSFYDNESQALMTLHKMFPNADFRAGEEASHCKALQFFQEKTSQFPELIIHLKATDFQLKVWHSLLKIPAGTLISYRKIAEDIQKKSAIRAVGTAIGKNPVAYIIPCHRVIQTSGVFGGYRWGKERKAMLIERENTIETEKICEKFNV